MSAASTANLFRLSAEDGRASLRLRVAGELDVSNVDRVDAALSRASRTPARDIVIDLRDVVFLDLAWLTAFARATERSRHAGFEIRVVPPDGPANRLFTLTDAGTRLTLGEDPSAA
jgi:anti-anti-sigma factor